MAGNVDIGDVEPDCAMDTMGEEEESIDHVDLYGDIIGGMEDEKSEEEKISLAPKTLDHSDLSPAVINCSAPSKPASAILANLIQLGSNLFDANKSSSTTIPSTMEKSPVKAGTRKPSFLIGDDSTMGLDLYEDLLQCADQKEKLQHSNKLKETELKLKTSEHETKELRIKLQGLEKSHEQLKIENNIMKRNFSVLYKTVQAEMQRKKDQLKEITLKLQKFELYITRRNSGQLPGELQDYASDQDHKHSCMRVMTSEPVCRGHERSRKHVLMSNARTGGSSSDSSRSRSSSPCIEDARKGFSAKEHQHHVNVRSKHRDAKVRGLLDEHNEQKCSDPCQVDLRNKLRKKGHNMSQDPAVHSPAKDPETECGQVENDSKASGISDETRLKAYLSLAKKQEKLCKVQMDKSKKSGAKAELQISSQGRNQSLEQHISGCRVEKIIQDCKEITRSPSLPDDDDNKLVIDMIDSSDTADEKTCLDVVCFPRNTTESQISSNDGESPENDKDSVHKTFKQTDSPNSPVGSNLRNNNVIQMKSDKSHHHIGSKDSGDSDPSLRIGQLWNTNKKHSRTAEDSKEKFEDDNRCDSQIQQSSSSVSYKPEREKKPDENKNTVAKHTNDNTKTVTTSDENGTMESKPHKKRCDFQTNNTPDMKQTDDSNTEDHTNTPKERSSTRSKANKDLKTGSDTRSSHKQYKHHRRKSISRDQLPDEKKLCCEVKQRDSSSKVEPAQGSDAYDSTGSTSLQKESKTRSHSKCHERKGEVNKEQFIDGKEHGLEALAKSTPEVKKSEKDNVEKSNQRRSNHTSRRSHDKHKARKPNIGDEPPDDKKQVSGIKQNNKVSTLASAEGCNISEVVTSAENDCSSPKHSDRKTGSHQDKILKDDTLHMSASVKQHENSNPKSRPDAHQRRRKSSTCASKDKIQHVLKVGKEPREGNDQKLVSKTPCSDTSNILKPEIKDDPNMKTKANLKNGCENKSEHKCTEHMTKGTSSMVKSLEEGKKQILKSRHVDNSISVQSETIKDPDKTKIESDKTSGYVSEKKSYNREVDIPEQLPKENKKHVTNSQCRSKNTGSQKITNTELEYETDPSIKCKSLQSEDDGKPDKYVCEGKDSKKRKDRESKELKSVAIDNADHEKRTLPSHTNEKVDLHEEISRKSESEKEIKLALAHKDVAGKIMKKSKSSEQGRLSGTIKYGIQEGSEKNSHAESTSKERRKKDMKLEVNKQSEENEPTEINRMKKNGTKKRRHSHTSGKSNHYVQNEKKEAVCVVMQQDNGKENKNTNMLVNSDRLQTNEVGIDVRKRNRSSSVSESCYPRSKRKPSQECIIQNEKYSSSLLCNDKHSNVTDTLNEQPNKTCLKTSDCVEPGEMQQTVENDIKSPRTVSSVTVFSGTYWKQDSPETLHNSLTAVLSSVTSPEKIISKGGGLNYSANNDCISSVLSGEEFTPVENDHDNDDKIVSESQRAHCDSEKWHESKMIESPLNSRDSGDNENIYLLPNKTASKCDILHNKVIKSSEKASGFTIEPDFSEDMASRDDVLSGEDILINDTCDIDLSHSSSSPDLGVSIAGEQVQDKVKKVNNIDCVTLDFDFIHDSTSDSDNSFNCPTKTATPNNTPKTCVDTHPPLKPETGVIENSLLKILGSPSDLHKKLHACENTNDSFNSPVKCIPQSYPLENSDKLLDSPISSSKESTPSKILSQSSGSLQELHDDGEVDNDPSISPVNIDTQCNLTDELGSPVENFANSSQCVTISHSGDEMEQNVSCDHDAVDNANCLKSPVRSPCCTPQKLPEDILTSPDANCIENSPWRTPVHSSDLHQKSVKPPIFDEESVMSSTDVLEIHAKDFDFGEDSNAGDAGNEDKGYGAGNSGNVINTHLRECNDSSECEDFEEGQIDSDSASSEVDDSQDRSKKGQDGSSTDLRGKLLSRKRKALSSPGERKRRKSESKDSSGSHREVKVRSGDKESFESSRGSKHRHTREESPRRRRRAAVQHRRRSNSMERPRESDLSHNNMSVAERKKLAVERARARELDRKLKCKDRETALLREKLRQLEWERFIQEKEKQLDKELLSVREKVRDEDRTYSRCEKYGREKGHGKDRNELEKSSHSHKRSTSCEYRSQGRRRSVSPPSSSSRGTRHRSRERGRSKLDKKVDSHNSKETQIEVYVRYHEKDKLKGQKDTDESLGKYSKVKASTSKSKESTLEIDKKKHSKDSR